MTAGPTEIQSRLQTLPDRHLAALRAALAGFSDADIAGLLGIPVESVTTTVRLAAAKLTRALNQ
jgi:DNA-directed RNA polymerase specialized sigma24 family protein